MSTKHTFTHPDGSVSKRTSANRVYPFAVEVVVDNQRYADHLEQQVLPGLVKRLVEIEDAINAGEIEVRDERRTYGLNHTVYVGGIYAGGWTTEYTYGNKADEEPVNLQAAARALRDAQAKAVANQTAEIEELRSGPTHTYGIVSWTSRADLADKEASRSNNRSYLYRRHRVVETTYVTK